MSLQEAARREQTANEPHLPFYRRAQVGEEVVYLEKLRSTQHGKPKTLGAYRVLGFANKRQTNLLPDRPETWGSINKVPDDRIRATRVIYGSIEALKIAPEFHVRLSNGVARGNYGNGSSNGNGSSPKNDSESGAIVTTKYRAGATGDGLSFVTAGVPRDVRLEQYKGHSTLLWPTDMKVDEFMTVAQEAIDLGGTEVTLFVTGEERPRTDISPEKLTKLAAELGSTIELARVVVSGRDLSVGWQRSAGSPGNVEGAITAVHMPLQDFYALLEATATEETKDHRQDLFKKIQGVLKR